MKNVLELLERTAARLPRQTAFADQQCSYDYQTVVNIAESVGSALAANGDRNCPVAVLMERGAPCLVTLMGVLYSGNFYVVLDPEMPAERVNKILRTLQPTALICDEAHKDDPAGLDYDGKVYSAEALAAGQAQPELLQTVRRRMIDTDPAYAIFTSGSTGNPKGVVVNHRSVLAYSAWAADTFGISEKTIFGNQTPFYFSMSVTDIYATIRTGAQLHVIPKSYFSFPALLIRYLNERQVNTIYWVPSALSIVANLKVLDFMMAEHIEKVLFAGEVMPAKQLNYWRSKYPNALFANLFGPTETTDICTYYIVDREIKDTESVPIGIACDNCDSFVVTEDGRLAGIGEEGELYARGSFLAMGYYNDPDKTAAAFVQNPLQSHYPERVYKTGDLVRWNERGELIYLSRRDFQIKHMGYRIELGEIEASKLSSGNITLHPMVLDLGELTAQAIGEYQKEFEENRLQLVLDPDLPRVQAFADGSKTYRVLENLLQNAKKYSAVDSRVYVRVYKQGDFGVFEIKNISAQPLNISPQELTQRFVRGDASRTKEGNGLGLSIAQELCSAQQGKLELLIDGDLFKARVYLPQPKNALPQDTAE